MKSGGEDTTMTSGTGKYERLLERCRGIAPVPRHRHPFAIVVLRMVHLEVRFGSEDLVETHRVRIVAVLQHVVAEAPGFLPAARGMSTHVPQKLFEVIRLDADRAEHDEHAAYPRPVTLRHASSAAKDRTGPAIRNR